jgi:DNA-dependent protein kinase catalytic subunit
MKKFCFFCFVYSGEVIGIDFGHAFGTATQFLPIPELVPFRLTQQFVNFLLPLGSEGLLKQSMIHTLNALRAGKQVLLNVMDVFVQEPLLDWQKLARRVATIQRGVEKSDDETHLWFPKKKIDIAKRKLELVNPAFITLTELNESIHCNKSYMPALKDIVLGDPKVNFRATLKEKCLTTKQQVECLLDQATDPNILGRAWGGWAAWI